MYAICSLGSLALAALVTAAPLNALPTIPLLRPAEPAPNSIVATPDGTIYFVDALQSTVWRLQPNGHAAPFVTGTTGPSLHVDAEGNVYGTHIEARGRVVLWRADPTGTMTEVGRASTPSEARRLLAATWDARESMLPPGEIDGMTRMRSGELVITHGPAIRKVGLDGRVKTVASGGTLLEQRSSFFSRLLGTPSHLTGVAVAANGDIYVANSARRSVVLVQTDGRVREVYTAEPGWRPTGVAASAGAIYVLEYGIGVRVRRLEASGAGAILTQVTPHRSAAASPAMPWLPI
jgi:sugar lactone lactonase YvrE